MPKGAGSSMAHLDTDGDGKLSANEWAAADADGDGRVDMWDLRQSALKAALQDVKREKAAMRANRVNTIGAQLAVMKDVAARAKASKRFIPPAPKPKSEVQQLLAQLPQTETQTVGFHTMPTLSAELMAPPKAGPPGPALHNDIRRLRQQFPDRTCREVGFHTNFSGERKEQLAEIGESLHRLDSRAVAADPQLAAALKSLQTRVNRIEFSKVTRLGREEGLR